jgi:hypothetical protein
MHDARATPIALPNCAIGTGRVGRLRATDWPRSKRESKRADAASHFGGFHPHQHGVMWCTPSKADDFPWRRRQNEP